MGLTGSDPSKGFETPLAVKGGRGHYARSASQTLIRDAIQHSVQIEIRKPRSNADWFLEEQDDPADHIGEEGE